MAGVEGIRVDSEVPTETMTGASASSGMTLDGAKPNPDYNRSSSVSSQSSHSSAGTGGGQSGSSSIRSIATGGSSSVHSLDHIYSVTVTTLTALMDKIQTVENKEVKTAQDQLNNAQERLTTYGKNEENLKRAGRDLEMAKSNAELGYNSTEDLLTKVHATRIICSSTMYLNYPASLKSGRDECIRRLSMLYNLSKVQEAFQKVTQEVSTSPGMFARWWSYPDPERTSQEDLVREVCRLDELIYRFLYAGGLITERVNWPQVDSKSPMLLAYDRALVGETVPLFTSVSLPGVKTGSGFVDITTSSNTATLISKNAQHVAVADLAEDEQMEFVYESVEQDASSFFPSTSCIGVDSVGKVHFTTEGQDRVWIFTLDQPQQGRKLSASLQNEHGQGHKQAGSLLSQQSQMLLGSLQCICGQEKPSTPRPIAVELGDVNGGGTKRKTELQVVSMAAADGIVDILVSTTHQAWVVRVESDTTTITTLNVHCDLLPLQRGQCCLVPGRFSVLHINLRWSCDEERRLCPGLYEFDTITGEAVRSDTSPIYTTSHSGRLTAVSYTQPQQGQKLDSSPQSDSEQHHKLMGGQQHGYQLHLKLAGHPQNDSQKDQKLASSQQTEPEQGQTLAGGPQNDSQQPQKLSGSPQNDTKQGLLLVELCPDDPYCETSDTKTLRVVEADTQKELVSWKSTSQSKSLDACIAPDGNVIAVLDDASIFIYDLQTGHELALKTGLRDGNLSPCRICWYGERFVLLTFKNTPEVHKIPIRL